MIWLNLHSSLVLSISYVISLIVWPYSARNSKNYSCTGSESNCSKQGKLSQSLHICGNLLYRPTAMVKNPQKFLTAEYPTILEYHRLWLEVPVGLLLVSNLFVVLKKPCVCMTVTVSCRVFLKIQLCCFLFQISVNDSGAAGEELWTFNQNKLACRQY